MRAAVFVALHRLAAVSSKPPYQSSIVKQVKPVLQSPLWRPARRQDARRYVKELRSLCEGTWKLYIIAPMGAREK